MEKQQILIDANMATQIIENEWANSDPFAKSWDDLISLNGIEKNFKRRVSRIEKAAPPQGMSNALDRGANGTTVNSVPRDPDGQISRRYLSDSKAIGQNEDRTVGSKKINPGQVYRNGYGIFDLITPPYNLYELSAYYDTSFANHAAIDAKVSNTVGLGYKFDMTSSTLMKLESMDDETKKKNAKRRIEKLKIQLGAWIEELNDDESLTKILEKVVTDMQATGNGYIEVGRTVTGDIGYVGHIPATTMRVRRLHDGYIQIIAGSLTYFRNFGATNPNPVTSDNRPNEVIHLKEYSPLNTFYGVPDIMAAMTSLQGDQMAQRYNIDYFENKAVPRYIITVKGAKLTPEAEDKLFRFFQTGLKGQSHRTLYIPLPGDSEGSKIEFEMHPVENGVQEASFGQYRKQNRDDILMAHQVPLSKLGGVDAASTAASMTQDRTFRDQVARPLQEYVAKAINKIIREKTDIVELNFNQVSLTDEIAESQILERYVKNQILVPNEAREVIGYPQRDGADKPLELNPRQAADAKGNMPGNKTRDAERTNEQSDGAAAISGRNPKGTGAKTD
jgi:PBSX family phage portal protein